MEDSLFSLFQKNQPKKERNPKKEMPLKSGEKKPPPKTLPSNLDIQQMIEKMKDWHDDLERRLDEAFQKTGLDSRTIKTYLSNPNNFSSQKWQQVQNKRKELLDSIVEKMGKEVVSRTLKEQELKEADQASKGRKNKTIGARRKWIPMQ